MIAMAQSIPIINGGHSCNTAPSKVPVIVLWLQGITLTWMLLECVVSLYAAKTAHSVALLAFGSDSLVELLSASVALASFIPSFPLTKDRAARWAGILLFILAAVVAFTAILALARGIQPETSCAGIGITAAALVVMPALALVQEKDGKNNWQSRPGCRRRPVSGLCLPRRGHAHGTRHQRDLSNSLDRSDRGSCSCSSPYYRGAQGNAWRELWLLDLS